MALVLKIDYRMLAEAKICNSLLGLSFVLLILVAIPGVGKMLNGSRRWLRLGPVSFQPSELAKYASILFLARALSMKNRDPRRFFTGLMPLFIIPGAMFMLILLQPNLSTAGSILIVAAVMVMMAGARWRHLAMLGGAGTGAGRVLRHVGGLSPCEADVLSKSLRLHDQRGLSAVAVAAGLWFRRTVGMGLGLGRQKYAFLPYPESDFIFAVVGEDLGLIGCVSVLTLFAAFVFFGLRIAIRCEDRFGACWRRHHQHDRRACVLNVAVVTA